MTSAQIDTIQALENENKILADEVKMKEELIPGLEKMIAYLQKIQEENKKLKEDLKFSEDKVRDLTHEVNDRVVIEDIADLFGLSDEGDEFDWESEIGGMILDNKKLKEENKKLKEENKKPSLKKCLSEAMKENGDWMTHMKQDYEVQLRTQKEMVSMYLKENKKLEEENKNLKRLGELADFFEKEYHNALDCQVKDQEEYEKENKQLKEEINLTNTALDMVKDENEVNKKNLMKVMEENKKLKEEVELLHDQLEDDEDDKICDHSDRYDAICTLKDINGKNIKIPTEEECQKNFGVSREDFIMLAKKSDCGGY